MNPARTPALAAGGRPLTLQFAHPPPTPTIEAVFEHHGTIGINFRFPVVESVEAGSLAADVPGLRAGMLLIAIQARARH